MAKGYFLYPCSLSGRCTHHWGVALRVMSPSSEDLHHSVEGRSDLERPPTCPTRSFRRKQEAVWDWKAGFWSMKIYFPTQPASGQTVTICLLSDEASRQAPTTSISKNKSIDPSDRLGNYKVFPKGNHTHPQALQTGIQHIISKRMNSITSSFSYSSLTWPV